MAARVLPLDSIFHATDFSAGSELAFVHALKLATLAESELTILHASASRSAPARWGDYPGVRKTLERWSLLPEGSPPEAVSDLGLIVEKVEARGSEPVKGILAFLGESPAELIVLATEGRDGLPRWLHHSVAEPVARKARAMTLFVPHDARGFVRPEDGATQLRRVVVPVVTDPRPQPAVAVATSFLRGLGSGETELTLVHVGEAAKMPAIQVDEHPGLRCQRDVREGDPVEEILGCVEDRSADLLVMATKGRQGFLDALRGTTTEQVLRRAPCPVLAIPEA
jgi:nucleotide-binding universal stress UspA family protein